MRLLISDQEIELNDSAAIVLNAIVLPLLDLHKRGVLATNVIKIPMTLTNRNILLSPDRFPTNNLSYETLFDVKILDKSNIIAVGQGFVKSHDSDNVNLQVKIDKAFFELIDRPLNDLSLEDYDFQFNNSGYNALRTRSTSPFVWTAIQNLDNGVSNDTLLNSGFINLEYSRPSYYLRRILELSASEIGYNLNDSYFDLFELTNLNDLALPSNLDDFKVSDFQRNFTSDTGGVQIDGWLKLTQGTQEFISQGNASIVTESGVEKVVNAKYKTSYVLKGSFNNKGDETARQIYNEPIKITVINEWLNPETTVEETKEEVIYLSDRQQFINYHTEDFEIGSRTSVKVEPSTGLKFDDFRVFNLVNESEIFEVEQSTGDGLGTSILDGYYVKADYNLPEDLTQLDLWREIWKLYFFTVTPKYLTKDIDVRMISQLNKLDAVDITDKVDKSSIKVNKSGIFAKNNAFRYSNDDELSESYAGYNLINKNETAKENAMLIESKFSASYNETYANNELARLKIYADKTSDNPYQRNSLGLRLLTLQDVTGAAVANLTLKASFNSLNWATFYSNYYAPFIQSILRERNPTVDVLLNNNDFNAILKTNVVYIGGDVNSYFFCEKISKFTPNEFCNLSLIQLNY